MNKLSFEFIAEHIGEIGETGYITIPDQIVILIDRKKKLNDYGFGMFPSDFFSQDKHFFDGKLQVGICGCSCYECGDIHVDVNSTNDMVIWSTGPYVDRTEFIFDKKEYMEIINKYIEKYVDMEYYLKIKEIILKELKDTEIKPGYIYNMFRFYDYGTTIIISFETKETEETEETEEKYYSKWNGETEEKYYIRWYKNIENLIKEINEFKMEYIK